MSAKIFIVAEIGINHNGDINIAKKLIDIAQEAGADAVGFIFYKKSPRSVTIKTVCEIVDELPPFVDAIGIFVNESLNEIKKQIKNHGSSIISIHNEKIIFEN